jgi:hypothetical protein
MTTKSIITLQDTLHCEVQGGSLGPRVHLEGFLLPESRKGTRAMLRIILALIVSSFLFWGTAHGQPKQGTGLEANEYQHVWLYVGVDDAADIGLTEELVQAKAESLLRSAGMTLQVTADPHCEETLGCCVETYRHAFFVEVQFWRNVLYSARGENYWKYVQVYSTASFGTHTKDPEFVIDSLGRRIEKFLNDYSKANASLKPSPLPPLEGGSQDGQTEQ